MKGQNPNIKAFADGIAEEAGMTADHRAILDSNHVFGCDCDTCLSWWALCGPDGGEPGEYGPFTKDQVNERQRKLGTLVTL